MAEQNPQNANPTQEQRNADNSKPNKDEGKQPIYTQEQLDSIVLSREGRAADAALQSFFEKQGLSEDEIKKAVSTYKEGKGQNAPDIATITAENQKYMQQVLNSQIENKAILEAVKMGVDANTVPYVMKLADFSTAADEKGKINDEKIKDAISKVLTDVPQFKKATSTGINGFRKIGADRSDVKDTETINSIRKAFGLKPKA